MKQQDYIDFNSSPGKKRRLIGQANQVTPWYSISRRSNILIISILMAFGLVAKPLTDIGRGFKNALKLHYERKRINKELDEEEEREMKSLGK